MKRLMNIYFFIILSFSVYKGSPEDRLINIKIDNKKAKKEYDMAFSKWKRLNVSNYFIRLRFGVFSPNNGIWKITVKNKKAVKCIINGKERAINEGENYMTMDYLFEVARASYHNKNDSPFIITADFDKKLGIVRVISSTININSSVKAPSDKTFRYEVIEFIEE